ncbi:selenide, water dikinase SelD [Psychromarinibacter sp. C21-152]|uniref:Selenide, water dikinase SelD n=1 Tax=Psychromarinibacter sediminicola TaxID=3033385 RepID=A0AAE3T8H2_9RHOB|nr:selenide, water dikinase SelD [Psychromarinibacter sediminicola]MDF0601415.1 selenide, water dikinase SelD [Psychromarinibacter sediminicola]
MPAAPLPLTRELVLIGGGHAHALLLRRWGMRPLPGVRVTVIDPNPEAPYTGMLPGHVAGHYARAELEIDLVKLARFAGARVVFGRATGLDRAARAVHVAGRPPVRYDVASIDIGISSDPAELRGFAPHGAAAKPLGPYAQRWRAFRESVAAGTPPEVAVIGGGVGGVELSMAMAHALRTDGHSPTITVLDADRALPGLGDKARAALLANMTRLGVTLREGVQIAEVTETAVVLADGETVPSHLTVGAAGARPQGWLAETGLDLTDGFVTVGPTLQSVTDPAVLAAGDCAHLSHAPRPKAGVYAVRQAPYLYDNLCTLLSGTGRLRRYRPQADYLKLISLGDRSALMEKRGLVLQGRWLWRWKDRIDRKFMRKFHELPEMPPPALPRRHAAGMVEARGAKPACGGCGAKVGGATLGRVLAALPGAGRDDVLTRPGDDAAVLALGGVRQVVTTDHLRAFTEDPWTQTRIAAIHAMGDIWAMGATPQAALAQVILPRLAPELQEAWLSEIMSAAAEVFGAAGAEIVGGHSSLGAELTVGFTVTGLCPRAPITVAGARPGDALILTKPLGSGTILAAEMQGKARGAWVVAALRQMGMAQDTAAGLLAKAHAMSDVTGFGLAGHLMAICEASGVAAELDLAAVPVMPGAEELATAGLRSTLYPDNRAVAERMSVPLGPRAELLFDPQTAGGLLAAVPGETAERLLFRLQDAGVPAARIGRVVAGAPFVTVR